jgi:hypothetical protein
VRAALATRELGPEPSPFNALRERRARYLQRQLAWGSVAVATVALLGVRLLHHEEEAPIVRAETFTPIQREPAPSPAEPASLAPPRDEEPSVPPAPPPRAKSAATRTTAKPAVVRVAPVAPVAPVARAAAPKASGANGSSGGGGARACADLARTGDAEAALTCYERLASGSGMTAELALFERARLEGKALRRPDRALKTLEVYRRRFPNGSLRPEVMLARIDWLVRSDDREGARQAVDEALASGLLRERTAELSRLRDSLRPFPPALDRAP